jgi:predicted dienelactone hydrolase
MGVRRSVWAATWFICVCAALAPTAAGAGLEYKKVPGPLPVKTVLLDWKDAKRDRSVPVMIYYPDTPDGKFPVIIFSHGLGGSRQAYGYLGAHWASFGYVCVHLQHIGSDNAIWQGLPAAQVMPALHKAMTAVENVVNRPEDVSFAIDQLEKLDKDDPLFKARLDLDHIGMAGHSFGAYTTLAVAGEVFVTPGGREWSRPEPRIKAAIAMSAPAPQDPQNWDKSFAKIAIPILHMTGTLDDSPLAQTKRTDRRVPFDHVPATAPQYLIVLQGGDHMVFSARGALAAFLGGEGSPAMDPTFQVLIQQSTTAFWDASLKSDENARKWLDGGGCKEMLGPHATLEFKGVAGN